MALPRPWAKRTEDRSPEVYSVPWFPFPFFLSFSSAFFFSRMAPPPITNNRSDELIDLRRAEKLALAGLTNPRQVCWSCQC
jgi:hypothetical protein